MLHATAVVLVNLLVLLLHRLFHGSTSDFNIKGADLPVKCVCIELKKFELQAFFLCTCTNNLLL